MNANAYSEDQMIQAGTADFFEEHLGWRSVYAFDREGTGPDSLLGRSHRGEVVLARELRLALRKHNPKAPPAAIEAAISQLVSARCEDTATYDQVADIVDRMSLTPENPEFLTLPLYEAMAEAAPKHLSHRDSLRSQKIPGNATLARPGIGQRSPESLPGAAAT